MPRSQTNEGAGFTADVVVVGGGGHVGLPLAIALADRGASVIVHDISRDAVDRVNAGVLPFIEPGAEPLLRKGLSAGLISASTDPAVVATAENVIVVIGTPVDEHLNPDQAAIPNALGGCAHFLSDGQILILRSTVYPGVTALVEKTVAGLGVELDVAWPRPSGSAFRSPRSRRSGWTGRPASPTSRSRSGFPATCAGTNSPSGRACPLSGYAPRPACPVPRRAQRPVQRPAQKGNRGS